MHVNSVINIGICDKDNLLYALQILELDGLGII